MENAIKLYKINSSDTIKMVDKLSNRDKKIINTMFNHFFSNDIKIDLILSDSPQFRNEIIKSRKNQMVVNEIIDKIFDYETKLNLISLFYERIGYKFNSRELIENRDVIKINRYDFNWKNRTERKLCYRYA